jgi:hypothetical protein
MVKKFTGGEDVLVIGGYWMDIPQGKVMGRYQPPEGSPAANAGVDYVMVEIPGKPAPTNANKYWLFLDWELEEI